MPRSAVPLLLATLLLLPIAAPAQKSAIVPTNVPELPYRNIFLQHTHPADILALMRWQDSRNPGSTKLPDGVARIFALQSNNSLLLQATEAGYRQVQKIVEALDIAPQQVRMTVRFVAVPLSKKLTFDLSDPNQALLQMYNAASLFSAPVLATTDSGKPANLYLPWLFLNPPNKAGNHLESWPSVRLTPHVNKDSSVTLSLNAQEPRAQVLEALHTVSSNGTTVFDATPCLPPTDYRVFLFVTPTILSMGANGDTMRAKP